MSTWIFNLHKDEYDFYTFTPDVFHQYLRGHPGADEYPAFFKSLGHRLQNAKRVLTGDYHVMYMMKDEEIVGLMSWCPTKIQQTKKDDKNYMVRFVWIAPKFRGRGLSTYMMKTWYNDIGLKYDHVYETVKTSNKPSLGLAKALEYQQIGYGVKHPLTGKWTVVEKSDTVVFRKDAVPGSNH